MVASNAFCPAVNEMGLAGMLDLMSGAGRGGDVFWVSSVVGKDGYNAGTSSEYPVATVAAALAKCVASHGDVIFLMPGHNENIANAQLTWNVAGVSIIGLGAGSLRPRIDFDHANASIDVTANDMLIKNIVFLPSVTAVLIGIDIATGVTGTRIEGCEFAVGEDGGGTDEFVVSIKLVSGNHDTVIADNDILTHDSATGATHAISIAAAAKRVKVIDNRMFGTFSTGGIVEGAACFDMQYIGNRIRTGTNVACITANAATTGLCQDNYCVTVTLAINSMISAAAMAIVNCWGSNAAGAGAALIGAIVDEPDNILGADNNNNTFDSSNVAANQDGSIIERLEQIQEVVNNGTGTSIGTNKSVVDLLGTNGTAATVAVGASATSIFGAIGTNEADATTPFSSSAVQANPDGTLMERLEHTQQLAQNGKGGLVWYVDSENGSDSNDGLTPRTAKLTIGAARTLNNATISWAKDAYPLNEIRVMPGVYDETIGGLYYVKLIGCGTRGTDGEAEVHPTVGPAIGASLTISSISQAADASIVTSTDHGLAVGDLVVFGQIVGSDVAWDALDGLAIAVKAVTNSTTFTIETATAGYAGTFTSGSVYVGATLLNAVIENMRFETNSQNNPIVHAGIVNGTRFENCTFALGAGVTGVVGIRTVNSGHLTLRRNSFESGMANNLGYGTYHLGGADKYLHQARYEDNMIFAVTAGIYIAADCTATGAVFQRNFIGPNALLKGIDDNNGNTFCIGNNITAVDAIEHANSATQCIDNHVINVGTGAKETTNT